LFVFQSHEHGLHINIWKAPYLILAEQEIPEKTSGKDEEEEIDDSDVLLVPRWKMSEVISEGRFSSF
jgi:hypothetical protein